MWDWRAIRRLSLHDAALARVELLECRLLMNGAQQAVTVSLSSSPIQYVEKQGAVPIDPTLTVADPNGGLLRSASVQLLGYIAGEDTLSVPAENGILVSWDSSAGILTLSGEASVAAYQTALRSITYTDGSYDPATSPRIAQVTVTDSNFATGSASRAIVMTSVNDPPSILTPPVQTTESSTAIVFSSANGNSIIVSDIDANGAVEQVTLTASNGTLHLADTSGLSFTAGTSDAAMMTVTGTLNAINAALDGLKFTPSLPYASDASLEVSADDLGSSGIGQAQVVNAIVPIVVTGPAAPPPTVGTGKPPIPPTVGASAPPPASPPPSVAPPVPASPVVAERASAPLREIVEAGGASIVFLEIPNGAEPFPVDSANAARNSPAIAASGLMPLSDKALFLGTARANEPASLPRTSVASVNCSRSQSRNLFADRLIVIDAPIAAHETSRRFSSPPNTALHELFHRTVQIAAEASAAPVETAGLLRELDSIRPRVASDLRLRMWAGTASAISGGLSLAYFLWIARGGSLLSGMLSSIPTWKVVDPLPILDQLGNAAAALKRNEDNGLESLIKDAAGN